MNLIHSEIGWIRNRLLGEEFESLGGNCVFAWLSFGTLDSPLASVMYLRTGKAVSNSISERHTFHIQCTFYFLDYSENMTELDWKTDQSIFDRIGSCCSGHRVNDVSIGEYDHDQYLAIELDNGCEFEICIFEAEEDVETWRFIDFSDNPPSHMACFGMAIKANGNH